MKSRGTSILATKGSILTSGYVALDVVVAGEALGHRAGGTAANVAANLAFFGWQTGAAALIGRDPAGEHLRADLARAGVDTRYISKEPEITTPVVVHEILAAGHRFRFGCPVCGRRFARHRSLPTQVARRIVESESPRVFFFDRVSAGALALADACRTAGGLVVFEPATRGRADQFKEAVRLAHVVKFSRERFSRFADLLLAPKPRRQLQILTDGPGGAAWRTGSRWRRVGGYASEVIDSGGAGDWMTAAMLATLPSLDPRDLGDVDFDAVLAVAQAVGAISCRGIGARGLSEQLSFHDLRVAVADLMGREVEPNGPSPRTPRRTRRRAKCNTCLASG